ncbi:MAG: hypothetical protein HYV63_28305 [Candidatus Schekmanbacteria bacterium]|nr:hypothetical protein [Candidatus Schekmanbacteria bacterium]
MTHEYRIDMTLRGSRSEDEVLSAIDRTFRRAGYAADDAVIWAPSPSCSGVISEASTWPFPSSDLRRSNHVAVWFEHPRCSYAFTSVGVSMCPKPNRRPDSLTFLLSADMTQAAFPSDVLEGLYRVDFIVQELHRALDARVTEETPGDEPPPSDYLLYLSDEEWHPLGELPLEECQEEHLLDWLCSPDGLIRRRKMETPQHNTYFPIEVDSSTAARVPVEFSPAYQDFVLRLPDGRRALLRHCLPCGDALPLSRRDEEFFQVQHDQLLGPRMVAWQSFSAEDVIAKLGPPGLTLRGVRYPEPPDRREYGNEFDLTAILVYPDLLPGAVIVYRINPDGFVMMSWLGLRKSESNR